MKKKDFDFSELLKNGGHKEELKKRMLRGKELSRVFLIVNKLCHKGIKVQFTIAEIRDLSLIKHDLLYRRIQELVGLGVLVKTNRMRINAYIYQPGPNLFDKELIEVAKKTLRLEK